MPRQKNKTPDIPRLVCAMEAARKSLQFHREQRREAVREYVGYHWSEEGAQDAVPVNMLAQFVQIMSRQLVPKNPKALLSTFERQHWPTVAAMEAWINDEMERMGFDKTLRRAVTDGFFNIGILKTALGTPADAASFAWNLKAGSAFCECIDLDDFVFDIHARDFSRATYVAHRFRAPLDVVKNSNVYSAQRKLLVASTDTPFNKQGDERINMLGRGYNYNHTEEFEDYVDLWEVYLPQYRMVLTLSDDQMYAADTKQEIHPEPLREQQWIGPDTGPYRFLCFGLVPGNAMPKSPIQDLIDQHLFINHVYRKLIRQSQRQKQIGVVMGGATEDGERIMNANDGELVRSDNPEKTNVMEFGGPSAKNFQMFQSAHQLFKEIAGNLDAIGGLNPQAKTLGQDRLLGESATRTVQDLVELTIDFAAGAMTDLCWFWHHDPFKVMTSTYSVEGLPELTIPRKVTAQDRMQIPFEALRLKINPYSMQYQTPQQRLNRLLQIMQQIIIPMAPLLQPQGILVDFRSYLEEISKLTDLPELRKIITIGDPPSQNTVGGNQIPQPGQAPQGGMGEKTVTNRSEQNAASQANSASEAMYAAEGEAQPQ